MYFNVIYIVWLKSSELRAILQDRINHCMVNQVSTKKINQKGHFLKFFTRPIRIKWILSKGCHKKIAELFRTFVKLDLYRVNMMIKWRLEWHINSVLTMLVIIW